MYDTLEKNKKKSIENLSLSINQSLLLSSLSEQKQKKRFFFVFFENLKIEKKMQDITNVVQRRESLKTINNKNPLKSKVEEVKIKDVTTKENKVKEKRFVKRKVLARHDSVPEVFKETKGWNLLRRATKETKRRSSPGALVSKTHLSGIVIKALELKNESHIIEDMYKFFKKNELSHRTSDSYLREHGDQPFIDESIRYALVNWMTNLHCEFDMRPETLFLSVNLLDRFCEECEDVIEKSEIISLGVAALMLASKYEEVYYPCTRSFLKVTEGQVSKSSLLRMECEMLSAWCSSARFSHTNRNSRSNIGTLDFELTVPTAFTFLRRFLSRVTSPRYNDVASLAHYMCESTLQHGVFLNFLPSLVAASCVHLAMVLCGRTKSELKSLLVFVGYESRDLKICEMHLRRFIRNSKEDPLDEEIIQRKYSLKKFGYACQRAKKLLSSIGGFHRRNSV